jgi:protein involved in polysaccharide export with SLBB domain
MRGTVPLLFVLAMLLIAGPADAQQSTNDIGYDLFNTMGKGSVLPSVQSSVAPRIVPLESVVNPDEYIVGPSDGFAVTILTSPPLVTNVTVTPEGTLVVPSVGEIRLSDMTLTKAREAVLDQIHKRFISTRATVTLSVPRSVNVTVLGQILVPGTYTLSVTDRVSGAIDAANQVMRSQKVEDELALQGARSGQSHRLILVRHKDGREQRVDLARYAAERISTLNPYLREGDVIVVPSMNVARDVIGVYGAVHLPGRLEYVAEDSLHTMLALAYGFTDNARLDSVELYRYDRSGKETEHMVLNLTDGRTDLPLQPGDRLIVRQKVDLRGDPRVWVNGEVNYPGGYPISQEGTKLSLVVAMAGGFTSRAALSRSMVVRQGASLTQIESERLGSFTGGVPHDDSLYYGVETASRLQGERMSADFVALFEHQDTTQDVFLKDGDVITIPPVDRTVYVFGQVVLPGHVTFESGKDWEYYIARAGGLTDRARKGDIRIVKASTKQWLDPNDTRLEEGDYIWVPMVVEHNFGYYVNIIGQTASIIGVAVSLAILAVQLKK